MQHSVLLTIKNLLAGLLVLLSTAARAQTPDWQAVQGITGDVQVQASTTDGSGNVYFAGGFSGTTVFGSTVLSTTNGQEIFVAKWSPTSGFIWALKGSSSTTTGRNAATAIAVASPYVYVAGNFVAQSLTLGGRPALTNAQPGTSDMFLARVWEIGTTPTVSWAKRAGSSGNDYATSLSNYNSLYLYLGGSSAGNANFDGYILPNAGGFVARYSALNLTLPTTPVPAVPAGDEVTAVHCSNNNVYVAGTFSNAVNTMPSGTLSSAGGKDLFALKLDYNNLATQYWAQRAGGTADDYARCVLASGTNVYVGGSYRSSSVAFGNTTLTNAGVANLFVSKLTDAGSTASFTWALQNGGTSTDASNSANALGLYGTSLYVAGTFGGTASFGGSTLTSAGGSDVLALKVADAGSSGSIVGAQRAGGPGADYASSIGRLTTQLWYTTGQVTASTSTSFGLGLTLGPSYGVRPGFIATLSDPAPLLSLVAPNAGQPGSTVTLYGQSLTGTTAVTFAGTSNNVVTSGFTVNASGTQISGVVVPPGAQSGAVNVTTALGSSNGLVNYTVLTSPGPAPAWQGAQVADNSSQIRWAAPAANNTVIVAGEFSGSITLGSTTLTSAGGTDLFVAKFNPASSTYLWALRAGSNSTDDAYGGLAVSGNSIYVAGQFYAQSATFGSTTLTATQSFQNGYVAKLTDIGNAASFTWAQLLDDGAGVYVEALTASGNTVYVGGDFLGQTFTIGNQTLSTNASGDDGYVARLTDNGSTSTCNWLKGIGTNDPVNFSSLNVYGLSVSGSTVYVTGALYGTVSFGSTTLSAAGIPSGSSDIAVARLADNGSSASFTGAIGAGGTGTEFVLGMSAGPGGTLYVSGRTASPTWTGATVTGAGTGFVAKVTDIGGTLSFGWVQLFNSAVYQTAVNGTGIYAATALTGTETFAGTPIRSTGSSDGLVLRLDDAGSSAIIRWARAAGGLGADAFRALALGSGGQVVVGGTVTPLAAFGSIVPISSSSGATAALGVLNDPLLLATTPGRGRDLLALYPNPAHNQVTVRLPAGGGSSLTLLDALGRPVRRYPATKAQHDTALDLRGLPAGVYVLRCANASQRLIVQ